MCLFCNTFGNDELAEKRTLTRYKLAIYGVSVLIVSSKDTFLKDIALVAVLAAGFVAFSNHAGAQETLSGKADYGGFYLTAKVGVALPGDLDVSASAASANGYGPFSGEISFDPGPMFSAGVGMIFTPNIRGELELGYAQNKASSYSFDNVAVPNGWATGTVSTTSLAAVGYYDFHQFGGFVPYLSAGIAAVHVRTDDLVVQTNTDGTTRGSDTVAAVRLGAGVNYAVTEKVSLGLDYFALIGGESKLTFTDPIGPGGAGSPFSRTITSDTMGHALSAKLSVKF